MTISVPWPSTSSEPPSAVIGASTRGTASRVRTVRATFSSRRWSCLPPQPLKWKSMPARPSGPVTNVGPVSRTHRSSTATGITSTPDPQARWAAFTSAGAASSTTGSNPATVRAIRAMSALTSSVQSAQAESAGGRAMNVRACRWASDGIRRPASDGMRRPALPYRPRRPSPRPVPLPPRTSAACGGSVPSWCCPSVSGQS